MVMKKKFIAMIVVLCMLVSLSGCSSKATKDSETTTDSSTTTKAAPTTGAGTAAGDTWETPYPETVTISTVTKEDASAIYPDGDDITSNEWIRQYLSRFNVKLVTDWVSDDYDTKINLAIANNDLPDVCHVNASQLKQLVEANMLYDMTDVFDKYASDTVKGYMKADPDTFETGKTDGKLYGIPQMHYGFIAQPDFIWLRKDWMEEQKLEAPKTIDDVENICLKFMKAYGGYGMAVDKTLDYLNLLAIAWNAHPDMWIETTDGSIGYGSVQPEMKNALAKYADWYKKGILSADFPNYDFGAMNEAVVSGKVGVQPYYQWWGYNPGADEVKSQGSDAYFEPYAIPSADGQQVKQSIFFENSSYIVVSKKCKNPEAALKLIDFYAYIQNDSLGTADETLGRDVLMINDLSHVCGAFSINPPLADSKAFDKVYDALKTGDTSKIVESTSSGKYKSCMDWKNNKNPNSLGDYLQMGNGDKCAYAIARTELSDKNSYMLSKLWGAAPESSLKYGTVLDDLLTEGFTKIIIGAEPIDYFDKLVKNWYAAGGTEITKEMNEMYGK
jgi:ABC-type sugar transport system, periplasmic component